MKNIKITIQLQKTENLIKAFKKLTRLSELRLYKSKVTCPVDIDKNRAACARACVRAHTQTRTHTHTPHTAALAPEKPSVLHPPLSSVVKLLLGSSNVK